MEFKLPDIGEGVQEGELIKWLVKDGDAVQADQPLLEVMTDKATVEVPSQVSGVISGIAAKEGQMIKVGQVLAQIAEGGAPAKAAPVTTAPAMAPAPAAPILAKSTAPTSPPVSMESFGNGAGAYRGANETLIASDVPAAPIVRAMAQKAGVDLSAVPATGAPVGSKNRVLEEDLVKFLSRSSAPQTSGFSAQASYAPPAMAVKAPISPEKLGINFPVRNVAGTEEVERKPLRGLRRVISNAMVKSKFTAPHYSYVDEFECSSLVSLREEAKKLGEKMGVKITYLPFIVKAVVGALKQFPIVNSSLVDLPDGSQEVVTKKFFHIGVAVATPDGLVVPVIKHADQKSLVEIAIEINQLSEKVRAGKATSEELKGSTFSITSMGNIGGLFATPIINYPEVGIMGVYKVQEKPIVENGQIVIGKTMHVSLSLDHRVVDGAVGGYFCNAIIERLQNPARLMMEMI
jgi:pyruvate/2-oxoglutarate dehydrogenase complex dihydrolipoamide acyltransferase (E2) component